MLTQNRLSASLGSNNPTPATTLDWCGPKRMLEAHQGKEDQWHKNPYTTVAPRAVLLSRLLSSRFLSWDLPYSAMPQGQAALCNRTSRPPHLRQTKHHLKRRQGAHSTRRHLWSGTLARTSRTENIIRISEKSASLRRIAKVSFSTNALCFGKSRARAVAMHIACLVTVNAPVLAAFVNCKNNRSERQDTQKIHHCLHGPKTPSFNQFFKLGAATC